MKQLKKVTLAVITIFTLLLIVTGGAVSSFPLPSVTVGESDNAEPTPISEYTPLADDEDEDPTVKIR